MTAACRVLLWSLLSAGLPSHGVFAADVDRAATFAGLASAGSGKGDAPFAGLASAEPAQPADRPAPESACRELTAEARKACETWQINSFRHAIWAQRYREDAYNAHHVYTMVVFAIVCGLVLLGMYLSYREFMRDEEHRSPRRLAHTATATTPDGDEHRREVYDPGTNIELSASGIKVSSRVLGILVLVISMGFFYLYLATVYPINEASDKAQASASTQK